MPLVLSCLKLGREKSMEQNAIMNTKSEVLDLIAQHWYSITHLCYYGIKTQK